jgi:O-antigen ligase
MDFALFVVVTGLLLVRPAEVVPALLGLPLYEVAIIACALAAWPRVLRQLHPKALTTQPVTAFVVALLPAMVLSHLSHAFIWGARTSAVDFGKILLYYLLLIATVHTPARLRQFLSWLVVFMVLLAGIALVQYHGLVEIPGLTTLEQNETDRESGELVVITRLRGTGIYNDPNDLCIILDIGILLCLHKVLERKGGGRRLIWLALMLVFVYAVILTKSRGGLMALMAGLTVLFWARYGWRKALVLAGATLPLLLVVAGARQASLSTGESTSQERIQLWSEALQAFREAPVFGIGTNMFQERAGLVAHNSYMHCFAEMGLLGGMLFLGAFLCSAWQVYRLQVRGQLPAGYLRRLAPFSLAIVVAYGVGLLSLTRAYTASTYLLVGLTVAFVTVVSRGGITELPPLRLNLRLAGLMAMFSVGFLAGMYVFVRTFARFS